MGRGACGTIHFYTSSTSNSKSTPCHHLKHPATVSILKKNFGRRQDAIVTALGLKPSDKHAVSTLNGIIEVNTYLIDLCFNNGYRIANLRVLSGEDYSDFDYDVLIGMDVITQGDFAVSTIHDETTFTFRMPAQGITIE